jgi:ATP-binding cassette subfamily F protein uup
MDKIVDHLFIFRGDGWSKIFQETILILEPMKTVQRLHKEENKAEKKDWKQNNLTGNLTFNEQEYQKIEKRNQGFRSSKNALEQLFTDEKVPDNDISKNKRTRKYQ